MELKRHSLFELVDKLNQLVKFSGGSFTLKSGAVERVFIEDNPVEPVIMYRDGGGDYAIDAGGLAVFTAITAYSGDTRSPIPVISVHSVGNLQYRRQS